MSTLPMAIYAPKSRFSSTDFLMVSLWAAMLLLCLTMKVPFFLPWTVAGGAVLIGRHMYSVVWRGQASEGNLVIAVAMSIFCIFSGLALGWVNSVTPVTYDTQLARLDFGIAPAVRAWAVSRAWVMDPVDFCYDALPLALMIILVVIGGQPKRRMLASMAIAGVLVIPCYLLLPAVGPIHVGDVNAPRNCMPSMHLTWALFMAINSRGWARWAACIFVAITALATLATGEHYLPDLLAALPWSWAITWLAKKIVK
jgi:PAP2 superfamily